ncbi:calcium-binding protein, partial [Vibrio amylolyticus]|uniref:calcium-binding protein n=1 Tax=Vibrio amylolyticus TaxID=2847292 RepID=UPI00355067CE
ALSHITIEPTNATNFDRLDSSALLAGWALIESNGVYTLSNTNNQTSASDFEAALKLIQFTNSSADPSEVSRTLEVIAYDEQGLPSNTAITTVNVISVANPPIPTPIPDAKSNEIEILEDTQVKLTLAHFGITDSTVEVTVTSLPSDGLLEIETSLGNWEGVFEDQIITALQIESGSLRFTPENNESANEDFNNAGSGDQTNDYTSFNFIVSKAGALSEEKTLEIDVTPDTDVPEVTITLGSVNSQNVLPGFDTKNEQSVTEYFNSQNNGYSDSLLIGDDQVNALYGDSGEAYRDASKGGEFVTSGNDMFIGKGGNDSIYGGDGASIDLGIDTVVYRGSLEDYDLSFYDDHGRVDKPYWLVTDSKGLDTPNDEWTAKNSPKDNGDHLYEIERLIFSDAVVTLNKDGTYKVLQEKTIDIDELSVTLTDTDGSESLKDSAIKLTGIPEGVALIIGGREITDFTLSNGFKTFILPVILDDNYAASIENASLKIPADYAGSLDFNVSASAIAIEDSNSSQRLGQDEVVVNLEDSFDLSSQGNIRDKITEKNNGDLQWVKQGGGRTTTIEAGEGNAERIDVGDGGDKVESGVGDDVIFLGESDRDTPQADSQAERELNGFVSGLDSEHVKDDTEFKGNSGSNSSIDYAHAGAGNDTVYGEEGIDAIFGGTGDDKLYGGEGTDGLRGGEGDDFLSGGEGNDVLIGGEGNDILTGGEGYDVFKWVDEPFSTHEDIITDFTKGEDRLDFSELVGEESGTEMEALLAGIEVEVEGTGDEADIKLTVNHDGDTQVIVLQDAASQYSPSELSDTASLLNDLMSIKITTD